MRKKPIGTKLSTALVERIRNAVWFVGRGLTMNRILEEGITDELSRLEGISNGPFPVREEEFVRRQGTSSFAGRPKLAIVFRINPLLQERLRDAAASLGTGMGEIIETGATCRVEALERQYNQNKPFPGRKENAQ